MFKAGDLVYCPLIGTKIYKVEISGLNIKIGDKLFRLNGAASACGLPQIHLATDNMRENLSKVYGVEFDKLFSHNHEKVVMTFKNGVDVICYVSSTIPNPTSDLAEIVGYNDNRKLYLD